MWWALLALLSGSHVDLLNDPEQVRYCAASVDVAADGQAAKEGESFNVRFMREASGLYRARLKELGADDAAAFAKAKKAIRPDSFDRALSEKCGKILSAMRGKDSLLDAANRLDEGKAAPDADDGGPIEEDSDESYAATLKREAPGWLDLLPATRRGEVRCAMLASLVVNEVERGVSTQSYGLTRAKAETLAGRLAEAIMAENAHDADGVRAIYNADFEGFAAQRLEMGDAEANALFAAEMAQCQPLYASIDVSGDGDGVVTGLSPIASMSGAPMPDMAECHVILSHISIGIPAFKDEAKEFAAMKARLKARLAESVGKEAAEAELLAAAGVFSAEGFDALPEEEAEPQLAQCFGLAAE
ncbi:MAG: hypothetical protein IBJ13_01805 [Sphingopyxis sp.]|nr:hypothetical protein [Sphingopyxis sp.]